jgi:hypothetical protein
MKQIYQYFSLSQTQLSAVFFLLPLVLLAMITFSGTVSFVSAQTSPSLCEQFENELKNLKETKKVTEKMQRYKINEDNMRQNMSILDKAIANGRLMKQEQLEVLANNLGDQLPKEVGQMSPEERAAYQKETRDILVRIIDRLKLVRLEDLDAKLDQINNELDELEKKVDIACREDDEFEMKSCEIGEGTQKTCKTWIAYKDLDKIEVYDMYNMSDFMVINKWADNEVMFTRSAENGDNYGYSAVYTGRVSGKRIDGTVRWSGKDLQWTAKWYVTW